MNRPFTLLLLTLLPLLVWSQHSERSLNAEQWTFKKTSDFNWLPATVPGTVHTDLYNNKSIPNPFYGANEKQLQWIENEDWEYQTSFIVSKEELKSQKSYLQFDGLDTYAEVYLNGNKILSANNMFRTWKIYVKKGLKLGTNHLKIIFSSAVKKGQEEAKQLPYALPGDEKVFTRKAQYHYGWDWGPRFVTAGIYKKVALHFWNSAKISKVRYHQKSLTDSLATIEFITSIESTVNGKFRLNINNTTQEIQLQQGENVVAVSYAIQNPRRWWTNGLGEAFLYSFEITLSKSNQKLDERHLDIGLRTIELVQDKDAIGKSFYFKLNGIPVFMKGANYIPPDSFLPTATDSVYKNIVKNAVDSNMNMLRVWGGGVYADDAFYDACDKNGILVWQDFMFACAMYPGDADFIENVKQEVIDNVTRLQHHPCIALWCGNNENDEGWHNWGWQKQYNYSSENQDKIWKDYQKLFHEVIPETLNRLLASNENRYWPSSPSIGWGKKESLLQGDSHYWGVWWGMEPFEIYRKKVGRFMSEYGFQGMPNLKTFMSFAKEEELNLNSDALKNHQKHTTGYQTINEYMARDYKVPTNFEDYIYVSQLLQAEGMKTAIEAHRQAKPYCMGTLYWQLNDCWPVTSWSSIDYFGRWKAVHYQVKRSFENLLISVKETNTTYSIYLTNDSLENFGGDLDFKLMDFKGNLLWESNVVAAVPANSSLVQFEIPKTYLESFDFKKAFLLISFQSKTKSTKALHYFVKPKDLPFTKPNIQLTKIDELTYEITSDVLAKNVFLSSDEYTFFNDNFFDVLPNEKIIINLTKPVKKITAKSIFDTLP
ncbi:beta-mannosidase [Flavobacterium sp. 25HG05S-40]|uniref:beta-mannosidase n=1 Tax=Flavobacterium sp. 25HG05S-40 TaxID=3458682 RepID=UPI004043B95C